MRTVSWLIFYPGFIIIGAYLLGIDVATIRWCGNVFLGRLLIVGASYAMSAGLFCVFGYQSDRDRLIHPKARSQGPIT